MMFPRSKRNAALSGRRSKPAILACALAATAVLAACKHTEDEGSRVAGWSLVDPSQRHPIMVTQQPTTLAVKVGRGSYGLSHHQRAQVVSFLERYRTIEAGNTRMVIEVPSGSPNEVAAMQAVAEIRTLMADVGLKPSDVSIEAVQSSDAQAPIRVSYLRYVAEGPQCGKWPTNLAQSYGNVVYPNMGCATQANLAAMIANPADLVTPRASTPRSGERHDTVWDKYVKGESTISNKQADEKASTKGNQ
jgi:pilus assembly protein CpaD